ncbi:MAG TPA: hypothetical protein VD860_04185 [Azospirillum sp.]|nr:hypothetical protein [Azospirillum sp.]
MAEQIGRWSVVEHALAILHDGNVTKGGRLCTARTGLPVLGRSRERASALLDGIAPGGVRTHLLRVLRGGSLDAALTTDPWPARCGLPANEAVAQARRGHPRSVTLYDLLRAYGKPRRAQRRVRPATVGDGPQIQRFCRHLCGIGDGDWRPDDDAPAARTLPEDRLAIPWRRFMEERVPFLIGLDGVDVVGLAIARGETLAVLRAYPHVRDVFVPVLLEGVAAVMAGRGARRLEALVDPADRGVFEAAGWRRSDSGVEPGRARMELDLPEAASPTP